MRMPVRLLLLLLAIAIHIAVGETRARAQTVAPVFNGDPVAPGGEPYSILPGLPLFLPGDDEEYGTADDSIDPAIVGDVDVVVRAGGTYGGGAIPPPAPGVAAAPVVIAGGTGTGAGTEVSFQVILSNGNPVPAAGNALSGPQHDGRGALVVAYPDLDGDGVIGPTGVDGSADNQVEMQETLSPAGRQVGVVINGVASGTLGVSLGAPASAGGLGLVLVGGALIGESAAEHYFDGPWVSSLVPFMPPMDPTRIIGRGNVRPPDPGQLVEVELEGERFGRLAPGHAVLGTPFAIPLDGSSVTVDIVRSAAGAAVAAKLAPPVDLATFTAVSTRHLLAAVDPSGRRQVVEVVDALSMPDDGNGHATTLLLFAADLLGNPTDPVGDMVVTLELGPALALVEPDTDGDPQHEPVVLRTGRSVVLSVDDTGGPGDGGSGDRVTALVDGIPTDSLRIAFAPGGGGQSFTLQVDKAGNGNGTVTTSQGGTPCGVGCTAWASGTQVTVTAVTGAGSEFVGWSGCGITTNPGVVTMNADKACTATFSLVSTEEPGALVPLRTTLAFGRRPTGGRLRLVAGFVADPSSFDATSGDATVTLRHGSGAVIYSRTLPSGAFARSRARFSYRDAKDTVAGRIAAFVIKGPQSPRSPAEHRVRLAVKNVDLSALGRGPTQVTQTMQFGDRTYEGTIACTSNARGTTLTCVP